MSKTPIFNLPSAVIPAERIYPPVAPGFLPARLAHNVMTVLDVVLAVIVFQPQVETLASERGHAVEVEPSAPYRKTRRRCL